MTGNAAIQFHPDAYVTDRDNLMGRHAAGEGFLRGFLRHAQGLERLYVYSDLPQGRDGFAAFAARVPDAPNGKLPVSWAQAAGDAVLREAGCLYVPGPGLGEFARPRAAAGDPRAYSLCGVTHTISSHRAMDAIADLVTGPVQEWDAVICTSRCVRDAVEILLTQQEEHLRAQGLTPGPRPQLPVIPLGVDCDALDPKRAGAPRWRATWRERLGIGRHDLVVLFVGRLSFHAKAHPLPMLVALEEAAAQLDRPVHLIQSGWFGNDAIAAAFHEAADGLAPSIHHHFVDGRRPDARQGIWYAADVFCSLSDNIQETFGLTPIEAMAAGLPVVVSDWDGYKDTIPDGLVGLRVPTLMPPPGSGAGLAAAHASGVDSYDRYCGNACMATAVDIAACRDAFAALLGDDDRRAALGRAGRAHARTHFDWAVVTRTYQALWDDLAERRATAAGGSGEDLAARVQPPRPDPFHLFAGYPTRTLEAATRLRRSGRGAAAITGLTVNTFSHTRVGGPASQRLLDAITAQDRPTVTDLRAALPDAEAERFWLDLGWLIKLGLVDVVG